MLRCLVYSNMCFFFFFPDPKIDYTAFFLQIVVPINIGMQYLGNILRHLFMLNWPITKNWSIVVVQPKGATENISLKYLRNKKKLPKGFHLLLYLRQYYLILDGMTFVRHYYIISNNIISSHIVFFLNLSWSYFISVCTILSLTVLLYLGRYKPISYGIIYLRRYYLISDGIT